MGESQASDSVRGDDEQVPSRAQGNRAGRVSVSAGDGVRVCCRYRTVSPVRIVSQWNALPSLAPALAAFSPRPGPAGRAGAGRHLSTVAGRRRDRAVRTPRVGYPSRCRPQLQRVSSVAGPQGDGLAPESAGGIELASRSADRHSVSSPVRSRTPRNPNYRPTTRCIAAPLETCSFTL